MTRPTLLRSLLASLCLLACAGTAQAQWQVRSARFSITASKDHPAGIALAKTAECVAAKTDGKFKIRPFYDMTLGPEPANLAQVRSGSLDGAVISTAVLSTAIPQLGLFDLPFLFKEASEADRLLDGPFGKRLAGLFPQAGMVHLAFWENGFRHVTNSRRPVQKMEDIQGLKLRVVQSKVYIDTFTALGANAVPMPFTEVYSALETKSIDGLETTVGLLHANRLYEVQKYMSMTKHIYSAVSFLFSKQFHDKLTPQEQKVVSDCAMNGRLVSRQLSREMEVKSMEFLQSKGMTFLPISPAELDRMNEKTKPVYASQTAIIGADLMNELQQGLQKIRGQ